MKKFESKKDLEREELAINFFCNQFNLTYQKLDEFDIDYNIFKDGKHIANVEVKGRLKTIAESYPLPIAVRKILKLADSNSNPIIIWSCDDGIIFAKLKSLVTEASGCLLSKHCILEYRQGRQGNETRQGFY